MITTIWHNPRCSKSRLTLSLLEEQGIEPTVRQYLDDAPSTDELRIVINQLDMTPWDLLRRGEKVFKELDLTKESSDAAIISAMTENPTCKTLVATIAKANAKVRVSRIAPN